MKQMNRTKSFMAFMLISLVAFIFAECGSAAGQSQNRDTRIEAVKADQPLNMNKTAVVYFSRTGEQYGVGVINKGNTAVVAEMIADSTGADVFEIIPQQDYYPYTYSSLTDIGKKEQNERARPAYRYRGTAPDLSQYSAIFFGAPVWWGDWPMICYTFFENEDLSGKTLIPFTTHEGSGLSGLDRKLAAARPDSKVLNGLAIRGSDAQNSRAGVRDRVNAWISGLGIKAAGSNR